jgi:DNA-directed RNA polymerase subunit H
VFKKYGVTAKELPKIYVSDPAAIAIGAKVGDIIEITRKSPVAGEIKYYRAVIKRKGDFK